VFAQDDWTSTSPPASPLTGSGQASPRDNVVFEAGLFGGALGMRRTFILHASGAKLPSDLLGLTCVRYGEATTPTEMRVVNQKLRKAIENGPVVAVSPDGAQPAGAFRREPLADLARPRRRAAAGRPLMAKGRENGPVTRTRRGWTGRGDPDGVRRSRGRVLHDSCGHAPRVNERTAGVYWRADPEDLSILDGRDDRQRAELIADRLKQWTSITNA
jgi:predicted nucleotide-binding protein with TIR-like domain